MDLVGILSIATIMLYGMFGTFLIVGVRQKSNANVYLGLFFLLWAFNFLDGWLALDGFYLDHPGWAMWEEPFTFLYGPLIYFYTITLTSESKPHLRQLIPHLIPFALLFIILMVSFHLKPTEFKIFILQSQYELKTVPVLLIPIFIIFSQIFIYIILSLKKMRKFQKGYKNYHSTQVQWLNEILKYLIVILLLSLSVSIVQTFFGSWVFRAFLIFLIISILAFIIWVYFNALQDPKLFIEINSLKYQSNPLTSEDQNRIKLKVINVLEVERIFLKPEVTIEDLSRSISEVPRNVSQVINEVFNKSFFDLINSYRIEEAKKSFMNEKDPGKTILEVLYECGFNSKSSFNTQFKKYTGLTPSEYKRLNS